MTGRGADSAGAEGRLRALPEPLAPVAAADAAVVILLRTGPRGAEVLAEERAVRAGDPWSGQVGLPGGHRSTEDRTLSDTVLRELREELGVGPDEVALAPGMFGIRPTRPVRLRVAVLVGRWTGTRALPASASGEVAGAFWLPLEALATTERVGRETAAGPREVDATVHDGHVVWGFTRGVLAEFRDWLGGTAGGRGASEGI